jgi:outer membrane protein assembly factor BamB
LTAKTGQLVWQTPLNNSIFNTFSTMYVYQNVIYISSNNRYNAFDTVSGSLLWSAPIPDDYHGTTTGTICDGYVIFMVLGQYSNSLIAMNLTDGGSIAWNFTCPDSNPINWVCFIFSFSRPCFILLIFLLCYLLFEGFLCLSQSFVFWQSLL